MSPAKATVGTLPMKLISDMLKEMLTAKLLTVLCVRKDGNLEKFLDLS